MTRRIEKAEIVPPEEAIVDRRHMSPETATRLTMIAAVTQEAIAAEAQATGDPVADPIEAARAFLADPARLTEPRPGRKPRYLPDRPLTQKERDALRKARRAGQIPPAVQDLRIYTQADLDAAYKAGYQYALLDTGDK